LRGPSMPRPGEQVAAAALLIVPERVVLDGRCATCGDAMARRGRAAFRCARHDVPISLDSSCENYAPAPTLLPLANVPCWKTDMPTARRALRRLIPVAGDRPSTPPLPKVFPHP
jgi:hypothetical protein